MAGTGGLVLVVDDDPQIRQSLCWTLEDEGMVVEAAGDAAEALERAAARQPSLVILDMGLPGGTGTAVAAGLRKRYAQEIPILLITADGRAAEKARAVGAFAYLHKPFDLNRLVELVRERLGTHGN